jgi:hypothetical protein
LTGWTDAQNKSLRNLRKIVQDWWKPELFNCLDLCWNQTQCGGHIPALEKRVSTKTGIVAVGKRKINLAIV